LNSLPDPAVAFKNADLVVDETAVTAALGRMARAINETYNDRSPLVLGVMLGGLVPLVRLMRLFTFPHTVDYLHATRYRGATSGGQLEWRVAPPQDLQGRDVLIVDDILDEGITLAAIIEKLASKNPASLRTAVLVQKRLSRAVPVPLVADFVGLEVPDRYVFGCGMDYRGFFRNLDAIYALAER
jgi:hypoxanthine phosphoribosyltransferase